VAASPFAWSGCEPIGVDWAPPGARVVGVVGPFPRDSWAIRWSVVSWGKVATLPPKLEGSAAEREPVGHAWCVVPHR